MIKKSKDHLNSVNENYLLMPAAKSKNFMNSLIKKDKTIITVI